MAFGERKREIGVAARNQLQTNVNNTIFGFKNHRDLYDKEEPSFNKIVELRRSLTSEISYNVTFMNEELFLSPQQVTAMLFRKIKADVNAAIRPEEVTGCVIAVPSYFTVSQQKSVLLAAGIAKLECISLIKETTATAINYSFYKEISTPINVIFMDFGNASLQIFACAFSNRKLEILAEVSELIGGRDFDEMLADNLINQINAENATKENKRFYVGLLIEVEKLKEKMSANTDKMSLDIQHLLTDDSSTSLSMERSEMEEICQSLFTTIKQLMEKCLQESNIPLEEIHSIELVGGSSRIPKFKSIIKEVLGKAPIATMNQDEAVSRGAVLKTLISRKKRGYEIIEKPFQSESVSFSSGYLTVGDVR